MSYESDIAKYERKIQKLYKKISFRDRDAIAAYNKTQDGLHNLQSRAWQELTEEKRDEWRAGVEAKLV